MYCDGRRRGPDFSPDCTLIIALKKIGSYHSSPEVFNVFYTFHSLEDVASEDDGPCLSDAFNYRYKQYLREKSPLP